MIIDVWMQHPTLRFMQHEMFDSLRRWTKMETPDREIPVEFTIAAMDGAGVDIGLVSAWHGPDGFLISNDEVDSLVRQAPDRFIGVEKFAASRAEAALKDLDVTVGSILHPSPASPAANQNWAAKATAQLESYGIEWPRTAPAGMRR